MKKITEKQKQTLGVMWVLLNTATKYGWDSHKIVEVMEMIEKTCPKSKDMWRKSFEISAKGKVIFSWECGEVLSR